MFNNKYMYACKIFKRSLSVCMVLCLTFVLLACGKKEAVITSDGEDITETEKVYDVLGQSTSEKFSYKDLLIGNVAYNASEKQVKAVYGEPDRVVNAVSEGKDGDEKSYIYGTRVFGFYRVQGEFRLISVESTDSKDVFARGLSVGKTFDDILNAYYRDENCMNTNYYTADGTTALGKFLYGTYTMDSLETVKPSDKVEYGVINYNGFASLEQAESYIVEFTYFEPPYKTGVATTSDDLGQLAFDVDKNGKITAVRWYYYPEIQ